MQRLLMEEVWIWPFPFPKVLFYDTFKVNDFRDIVSRLSMPMTRSHLRVLYFFAVDAGLPSHVGVVAVRHVLVLREAVQTLHVLVAQMQQSQTLVSYSAHQAVHVTLIKKIAIRLAWLHSI